MTQIIVLASGSAARRAMLQSAGLSIVADASDVDEDALKKHCAAIGLDTAGTAEKLALAKAQQVQQRHPGKIVLGADQMLSCEGKWFDKPVDRQAASSQIAQLAGRTHMLVSAVVAVRDGKTLWSTARAAQMTMRPLSAAFIQSYLDEIGDRAFTSVGAYQVEGLGIQLFRDIEGDYFTILGMPLLPLLDFLRGQGALAT